MRYKDHQFSLSLAPWPLIVLSPFLNASLCIAGHLGGIFECLLGVVVVEVVNLWRVKLQV